uniref:Expansin-like CBD domain-containing protein n=1 Tax=Leersia perrieri TaxID=77586 RepID=A0A0D9WSX2_9ORYZ
MASSSSLLLAAAALAALLAVGSCGTPLTFKVGEGSGSSKLVLIPNVAISEVEVKEKGAKDWVELKESSANTWTLESTADLKGPFSVRFAVKNAGYRVVDDVIPAEFKAGSDAHESLKIQATYLARRSMASSSSLLLAAATLAAILAVGSCGTAVTFKVGEGSSSNKLVLVTNVAIGEVEVKEKGAKDWVELKESSTNTWTLTGSAALKGPFSVRFAVKNAGYRVVDDVIPAEFKVGSVYKTTIQV